MPQRPEVAAQALDAAVTAQVVDRAGAGGQQDDRGRGRLHDGERRGGAQRHGDALDEGDLDPAVVEAHPPPAATGQGAAPVQPGHAGGDHRGGGQHDAGPRWAALRTGPAHGSDVVSASSGTGSGAGARSAVPGVVPRRSGGGAGTGASAPSPSP